jgi:predicted kinase
MTFTVGPSGAGKSTWSEAQGLDVVSSDEIRKKRSPDGETPGSQSEIFHEVWTRSSRVLRDGRSVIVDAMHIEPEDRLRQLAVAPADLKIKYVIIDRPLSDKQRDGGWREKAGLVEKYHHAFSEHATGVLSGDGRRSTCESDSNQKEPPDINESISISPDQRVRRLLREGTLVAMVSG